jgi:dolichyl-phosphate beta-glucosyltransferase
MVMEDRIAVSPQERRPAALDCDHELTVIVPAYNEQSRLPATLEELGRALDAWDVDYRVVVADDGSTDGTAGLAEDLGWRYSTALLDRHRGKGAAVRNAMLKASGRVVAFTDADLPYELSALGEGYRRIAGGQCEVVFGARDLEQSGQHARRRLSRSIATFVFRQVIKRVASCGVTDTQCGLKLFSHHAAREVFSRTTIEGFAFDAEVVLLTHRLGLPFCCIPVDLVREYASTLSLVRDTLPMLWDVCKLWLRDRVRAGRMPPRDPAQTRREHDRKQAA